MRVLRLRGGWYKVIAVFSYHAERQASTGPHRLWLPAGEYPCHMRGSQRWVGVRDADRPGELSYYRLERTEAADKPCRCAAFRFPHKRTAKCKEFLNGPQ
jgi:hypothetical protein